LMVLFVIVLAWALPRLWRAIKRVFAWLGRLFGGNKQGQEQPPPPKGRADILHSLYHDAQNGKD